MNPNVLQSLELTVLGMALVILTLMIVAAVIAILGRICGTSGGTCEVEPEPATEDVMDVLEPTPPIETQNDEAAAIALAIALQRRAKPTIGPRRKISYPETETEIIGEVVNVVNINTGDAWANAGRLKAAK